ncbi:unnamed protein product [Amoebophrya sp. A120]|nr:unnamed protein product [Amoebophrya sp. A120]|eukprot:GSA120T00019924001.1
MPAGFRHRSENCPRSQVEGPPGGWARGRCSGKVPEAAPFSTGRPWQAEPVPRNFCIILGSDRVQQSRGSCGAGLWRRKPEAGAAGADPLRGWY